MVYGKVIIGIVIVGFYFYNRGLIIVVSWYFKYIF